MNPAEETATAALRENPHCRQSVRPITGIPFTRILAPDAPRLPYRRRAEEEKSTVHWGQRKLLMSEIEFLLMTLPCTRRGCTVVYAGAAPGTHVRVLADMFPTHSFILIDPAPFTVRPSKRIVIHQAMFTDALARELHHRLSPNTRVLFISDVRSCDPDLHTEEVHTERVKADMQAQARWHGLLKPFKSMLKFRLPYTPGSTDYLDGIMHLPVWGPNSTTECRLIVGTDAGTRVYDHTEHEEKMFHFNTVTRPALYPHSVCGCGIDHCYDCTAEMGILRAYLHATHRDCSDRSVARLSALISSSISVNRTLAHRNPERSQKISVIRRNQWRDGRPTYEKYLEQGDRV